MKKFTLALALILIGKFATAQTLSLSDMILLQNVKFLVVLMII